MPEDTGGDLSKVLDVLEDNTFDTPIIRNQKYKVVQNVLDSCANSGQAIDPTLIERILALCVHDIKDDKKYSGNLLMIISSVLKIIESGNVSPIPDLLPSALTILNIIKTAALLNKMQSLQSMCFEILLSYPDETLIAVAMSHPIEVIEVFNLYCHQRIPLEVRLLPCDILTKLLKILPPEKKLDFVKENLLTWFNVLIPAVLTSDINAFQNLNPVETLEMLAVELQSINYTDNPHWEVLLASIYNPKKYPMIMKSLLETGNPCWYRLWIVFIKLLKSQITRSNSQGSPINALLPVVETAFKMDVANRCRAFKCWDVLIDNFRTETNDVYVAKRLKLLIIPLLSNNAKVEETAIAKFNTWWHLLIQFQTRIDKFVDTVLIAFLNFCFGKNVASPKATFVPGLLSNNMKKLCIEAFIEMAGHLACPGCGSVPKLNGRLLTTNLLVGYWHSFSYSLQKVITLAADDSVGVTMQQVQCLWKSFVLIVRELPANSVRQDIFNELLSVLEKLTQESDCSNTYKNNLSSIILNLIYSLFIEENPKCKPLLQTQCGTEGPMFKILSIILGPISNHLYNSNDIQGCIIKLSSLTDFIMDEASCTSSYIVDWLLKNLSPNNNTLVLWTSLAQSMYETTANNSTLNYAGVLLWPLQNINKFTDATFAASAWYALYSFAYLKIKDIVKEQEICDSLKIAQVSDTNKKFIINASLAIMKFKLHNGNGSACETEVEKLMAVMQKIEHYEDIEMELPVLVDTLVLLLDKMKEIPNNIVAQHVIVIVMKSLKIAALSYKEQINEVTPLSALIKNLHKVIDEIYKNKAYTHLKQKIIEDFLENLSVSSVDSPLTRSVISILNKYILDFNESDLSFYTKIKTSLNSYESNLTSSSSVKQNMNKSKFTSPKIKAITRKAKKREASIVNTVVENGEEYVVVKSNWKFNPRKLTENQKEKLQRKREDIPALYQDLSQSQDEFKLATWKTDSQDTSTTSSSKSNIQSTEEVTSILKNIPSSEVVPKIIENIFSEKTDITKEKSMEDLSNEIKQTTVKNAKSPRIALKDRVFRNMRNLIEKSSLQKDVKDMSESLIQIENVPKTPESKEKCGPNLTNSAPPKINTERPSRVKRKPKKFDDTEIFALKKRRNQNDTQHEFEFLKAADDKQTKEVPIIEKPFLITESEQNKTEQAIEQNDKKNGDIISDNGQILILEENKDNVEINNKLDASEHKIDVSISEDLLNKTSVAEILDDEKCSIDKTVMTPKSPKNIEAQQSSTKKNSADESISGENSKIFAQDDRSTMTPESIKSKDLQESANDSLSEEIVLDEKSNTCTKDDKDSVISKCTEKQNAHESLIKNNPIEEHPKDLNSKSCTKDDKSLMTPKYIQKKDTQESSVKKNSVKKSRIEKELAIDMVEGHPFLKAQSEKRITRKKMSEIANSSRRKSLTEKINKTKLETKDTKLEKKGKEKNKSKLEFISPTVSHENNTFDSIDTLPCSEDIIESSQDSNVTTISVKSVKPVLKKVSVIVENIADLDKHMKFVTAVQNSTEKKSTPNGSFSSSIEDTRDDIELSHNKTALQEQKDEDLTDMMDTEPFESKDLNETAPESKTMQNDMTEDMDTQPFDDKNAEDVVVINDDEEPVIIIDSENTVVGPETQELAEADTQPSNSADFIEPNKTDATVIENTDNINIIHDISVDNVAVGDKVTAVEKEVNSNVESQNIITIAETIDTCEGNEDPNSVSSPHKDEAQRKKDFLDNTLEISPIKTMSPVRHKKSPSPETSSDFVVIKLTSPVQSNGEPFEKCASPEIFTEDKISPDKRDQSPPREEISVNNNSSPSSSLSLKKNRPQVRYCGRAAQMLGLCVPDRIHSIMNSERSDVEEPKRCSPSSTQARRNLRILYNAVSDNNENSEEHEDNENFLKLRRSLPTVTSSPSGPILKRKLIEIADEATISPASKRKRVSFHDPPVSTTVSVQKYIEPGGIRSPQNSALKRQERQLRSHLVVKSPKRLDNVFKLDTVLTKTLESFSNGEQSLSTNDTQTISLDETPAAEIVKTSDLNDKDPICPDLLDCDDPIDVIATELSSPAMKEMFLKEFEGKIVTIGDLAKMTELEVNRLCIKAPKVKVTRKVLSHYASKRAATLPDKQDNIDLVEEIEVSIVTDIKKAEIEVQTDAVALKDVEIQTNEKQFSFADTQTDNVIVTDSYVQTKESNSNSTTDVINSCLAERLDFVERLSESLENTSKQQIADGLPFCELSNSLMKKVTSCNASSVINSVLDQTISNTNGQNGITQLSFLQNYMCERFQTKDLILFCSQLLKKIHEKPV